MKYLAFFILAAFLTTDVLAQTCQDEVRILKWVKSADPVVDAEKAITDGNTKLMAVYGYTLYFPGADDDQIANAYEIGNYIAIEGTSDDLCSEEHERLNNIAIEYAKTYNKTLLGGK